MFPFRGAAFIGVMASCIGLVLVLPSSDRVLRLSAGIAAIAAVPLFFVANPLGGNMTRMVRLLRPADPRRSDVEDAADSW